MTAEAPATRVVVEEDKRALADAVANRFVGALTQLTQSARPVHVSLTGGSMGGTVLERVAEHPGRTMIDWSLVHFWWSDERFLNRDDPERNALQARQALLERIDIPAGNVHEPAAADDGVTLDDAAAAYAADLAAHAENGAAAPEFAVCFLGVGPDGHIASLFPDRGEVQVTDHTVLAVRDSPKPPPERVTFTRPVINASRRIWLVAAGADKAPALGLVLAGASPLSVPAAGAHGADETIAWVDRAAAADIPEDLLDD